MLSGRIEYSIPTTEPAVHMMGGRCAVRVEVAYCIGEESGKKKIDYSSKA